MKHISICATPDTISYGVIPADKDPVAYVGSGDYITVESVCGLDGYPNGISEILDRLNIRGEHADRFRRLWEDFDNKGRPGIHLITGPVYVEDAEPGDVLEIQIVDNRLNIPFGYLFTVPNLGALPDEVEFNAYEAVYDEDYKYARMFGYKVPLSPFPGIVAVGDRIDESSQIPGDFGGNIDLKYLTAGSSMFIPIKREGAFFFIGDPHAAQGNGEVGLSAIETAYMTSEIRLVVHKKGRFQGLHAEDAEYYYVLGLDKDLNEATRKAVRNSAQFIQHLDPTIKFEHALMLASSCADFEVTQFVDGTLGIHGKIPKKVLSTKSGAQ